MLTNLHLKKILFLPFLIESVSAFTISPWILPVIKLPYHPLSAQTTRLYFKEEDDSEALTQFLQIPVPDYFDGLKEEHIYEIAGKDEQSDTENSCQTLAEEMAESIDITREITRLDSFSPCIKVSCLVASFSVEICMGVDGLPNLTLQDNLFHYADVVTATLCILASIYTTVVFSMCSIYGRTAIGRNMDSAYDEFIRHSEIYRVKAFRTYLTSLWLFLFEITLTAAEQMNYIRYPFLMIISTIALFFYRDWTSMLAIANQIVTENENDKPR